ncbi:MAG TPA: hypothetical protein VHS06_07380 [Chloroflexota bacterium]|nr:hypothetical protein [Chloroflexota bacterium]
MRLGDVARLVEAIPLSHGADMGLEISCACAADLMSDVLAFAGPGALLLTGLTNPQVIRASDVAGVVAVLFVRGKNPLPETGRLAAETGIVLLQTPHTMFESCGRLYAAGLPEGVATGGMSMDNGREDIA